MSVSDTPPRKREETDDEASPVKKKSKQGPGFHPLEPPSLSPKDPDVSKSDPLAEFYEEAKLMDELEVSTSPLSCDPGTG